LNFFYTWLILPDMTSRLEGINEELWWIIRITIKVDMFLSRFYLPVVIVLIPCWIYLAYIWRPHRRSGPQFLLLFSIALFSWLTLVFFFSLLQMIYLGI